MSRARSTKILGGTLGVLGILVLLAAVWRFRETARTGTRTGKEATHVEDQELEPGKPVECTLEAGGTHGYLLPLAAGEYARVTVDQRGVDVKLCLRAPDGRLVIEVDSPNGPHGPERVSEVAAEAGTYRLDVIASDPKAPAGAYRASLDERRPATGDDRRRVETERTFAAGEELRRGKQWPEALERYRQALTVWQALEDEEGQATALYRIGWMQQNMKEREAAVESYGRSAALFRQLADRGQEAVVLTRLGQLQLAQEQVEPAREAQTRAVDLYRLEQNPDGEATALNNLGLVYSWSGRFGQAIECYQQALALWQRIGNHADEPTAWLNLGELYLNQAKLDDARDALNRALAMYQAAGDEDGAALCRFRLGALEHRLGDYGPAAEHLTQALASFEESKDEQGEILAQNSLGTTHLKAGEPAKALACYQRALELARKLEDRHGEATTLLNLGRHAYELGDFRKAFERHAAALPLFEQVGDRRGMASTRYGGARALYRLGEYAAARKELEASLDTVESLRGESESLDLRAAYFASKQSYWELYVETLMRLDERSPGAGFDARALQASERRRARSLLDLVAEAGADLRRGADPALLAEEREVQDLLNGLERQRSEGLERGDDESKLAALDVRERELLARLDRVRVRIRGASPRYAALTQPAPLDLPAIQRLLDDGTILLVYSLGEERSFLWRVSKRSLKAYVLPGRAQIEDLAGRFSEQLTKMAESAAGTRERVGAALAEAVLGPAAEDLDEQRLLVVGDGGLQAIPFAALPDPARPARDGGRPVPLVVHHEVVHLPSASVLATLRREFGSRLPAPGLVAVLADPVFQAGDSRVNGNRAPSPQPAGSGPSPGPSGDLARAAREAGLNGFLRLPHTRTEAEAILALVPEVSRFQALDFDASRETVLSGVLRRYRILHFATHGFLNARQPELSGLALSLVDPQGRRQNGFLYLHEIYGLDLPADLVVLSACRTGLGRDLPGEGLIGLTRGFMYAGAPRIVVSLWQVGDESTAELMRRFYRHLLQEGKAPAAALRAAQLEMLAEERWSQPYHWAGFIFQGDWRLGAASGEGGIEVADTGGAGRGRQTDIDLPPPSVAPPRPKGDG